MNIEELEKAERAAWDNVKAVRAEHRPPIDAAESEWYKLHVELMTEKQRALIRAAIEAENAK